MQWRADQVLAWTENDGPGRPPDGGGRALSVALTAVLGAVMIGIFSTDTLCPEHRAWVQVLATVAFIGVVASIVSLTRRSAAAPFLTMISAGLGVAIGLIDAVHAPQRGRLIAAAFAAAVLLSSFLAIRFARMAAWERRVRADLPAADVAAPPVATTSSATAPQARVDSVVDEAGDRLTSG